MLGFHNRPPKSSEDVYILKSTAYELDSIESRYDLWRTAPVNVNPASFFEGRLEGLGTAIGITLIEATEVLDPVASDELIQSVKAELSELLQDKSTFELVNDGMNKGIVTGRHFAKSIHGVTQ